MPIPNDPLGRHWVEASGENPALVEQMSSTLVAFLAFDHGRVPRLAGTGFVLAGLPHMALALTAKHVLSEGVLRIQKPAQSHALSALFVPASATIPSLSPERLKVVWMGSRSAGLLNVAHACFNDSTDISSCLILPQELDPPPFEPRSVPLDTRVPSLGDLVQMVSHVGLEVTELTAPVDRAGREQAISLTRRISIRYGTVTAVYPSGFRQYAWPCFTTSIPAEPGMSGGFVSLPIHGTTVAACGIVCADNSTETARSDFKQSGESVIACAWPALALRVPEAVGSSSVSRTRTLLAMMQGGDIQCAIGGIDRFKMIELPNGECMIANT